MVYGVRRKKLTRSEQIRRWSLPALGFATAILVLASYGLGGLSQGVACGGCHAMAPYARATQTSSHGSVTCIRCHATSGFLGIVRDGVRLQAMTVGSVFGALPHGSAVADGACRSCHRNELGITIDVLGVRVRHEEVLGRNCAACHGGSGHNIAGHLYRAPSMDACVACHPTNATDVATCDFCHTGRSTGKSKGASAWKATHGPGWEKTHGSGDLTTCVQCHAPSKCSGCHGVGLPHPASWMRQHGVTTFRTGVEVCHRCHGAEWCTDCHGGVEMPHPVAFLPTHGKEAGRIGPAACLHCHVSQSCDACHYQSAHPHVLKPPKAGSNVSSSTTGGK